MLAIFPILLFIVTWTQIVLEYRGIEEPLLTLILAILCTCLLLTDLFSRNDYSLYWAHMFIVWAMALVILCVLQVNVTDFQIGCWVFSSVQWQIIRILMRQR